MISRSIARSCSVAFALVLAAAAVAADAAKPVAGRFSFDLAPNAVRWKKPPEAYIALPRTGHTLQLNGQTVVIAFAGIASPLKIPCSVTKVGDLTRVVSKAPVALKGDDKKPIGQLSLLVVLDADGAGITGNVSLTDDSGNAPPYGWRRDIVGKALPAK